MMIESFSVGKFFFHQQTSEHWAPGGCYSNSPVWTCSVPNQHSKTKKKKQLKMMVGAHWNGTKYRYIERYIFWKMKLGTFGMFREECKNISEQNGKKNWKFFRIRTLALSHFPRRSNPFTFILKFSFKLKNGQNGFPIFSSNSFFKKIFFLSTKTNCFSVGQSLAKSDRHEMQFLCFR